MTLKQLEYYANSLKLSKQLDHFMREFIKREKQLERLAQAGCKNVKDLKEINKALEAKHGS